MIGNTVLSFDRESRQLHATLSLRNSALILRKTSIHIEGVMQILELKLNFRSEQSSPSSDHFGSGVGYIREMRCRTVSIILGTMNSIEINYITHAEGVHI